MFGIIYSGTVHLSDMPSSSVMKSIKKHFLVVAKGIETETDGLSMQVLLSTLFSSIDTVASKVRTQTNRAEFMKIVEAISDDVRMPLDARHACVALLKYLNDDVFQNSRCLFNYMCKPVDVTLSL
jgi:hypothetical protein